MSRFVMGVEALDKIFSQMLETGALIVIAGNPGSGKTTLASTICYSNAGKGHKCLYISFQEDKEKLFRTMKRLGIDLEKGEAEGYVKYVKLPLSTESEMIIESFTDIINKTNPDIVVVDSVTPLLKALEKDVARRAYLQNLFYELASKLSKLVVLVAEIPYGSTMVELGDIEFVADLMLILFHRIEHGYLSRDLEIRKARGAPITVARAPFTIVEGRGLKVYMPTPLEEIPPQDPEELYPPCHILREAIEHIHRGFVIYIEHPAHMRPIQVNILPLSLAFAYNLKVLYISYRYSETDMKELFKRLARCIAEEDKEVREKLLRFMERNFVLKGINPFSMSLDQLYMYEMELIDSVNPDIVAFHGIEIPSGGRVSEYYLSNLYNKLVLLKKNRKIVLRISSYINDEFSHINSALADIVIKTLYSYGDQHGHRVYMWRRGSAPRVYGYEELVECTKEFREFVKKHV